MVTIRSRVLAVVVDNPYRHLSVETIRMQAGEDLTRRQVITALHGLRDGLGDQLQLSAAGTWIYTPPPIESRDAGGEWSVPLGWERLVRVVAKFGPNWFLLTPLTQEGEPTGTYLWATAVGGQIEWIEDEYPHLRLP